MNLRSNNPNNPDMNPILIACDGACSGNGKDHSPGGWGAVLRYKGHQKELCGGSPSTTNNIMELTACIEALSAIKNPDLPIVIYCDSAYVVNCFEQKWYVGWEKNGWKNSKKQPVENRILWEQLLSQVRRFKAAPEFVKIKGHLDLTDESKIESWHRKLLESRVGRRIISAEEYREALSLNHLADELANRGMAPFREIRGKG